MSQKKSMGNISKRQTDGGKNDETGRKVYGRNKEQTSEQPMEQRARQTDQYETQ